MGDANEPEDDDCPYVRSLDEGASKDRVFWWAMIVVVGLLVLLSINWPAIF